MLLGLHDEWIHLVLREMLEYDSQSLTKAADWKDEIPFISPFGNSGRFSPDYIIHAPGSNAARVFISVLPPGTDLSSIKCGDDWPISRIDRMILLCRKYNVRLGLLSNGEQWIIVNAPVESSSGTAIWFARLWFQEPITLKAFQSLLNVRRIFGPANGALETLLQKSLEHQEEVTDTLGEQVRRAVEVLIQGLDKANEDRNRELLREVKPAELYEAGLTVMMRLVFILCAEERGLLLLGDETYDAGYAISTLRGQLAEEADKYGQEILDHRFDAWARLLAVFRAIYGGIEHENLRMPALGGSLVNPDRFSFLEGRAKGTSWREFNATPLPIDNRTVLLLLNSLQILEQSGGALLLSYKALDVEQIGQIYEGLLEYTAVRVKDVTLGLQGAKKAKNPNRELSALESALLDGERSLVSLLKETTQRSESALKNDLVRVAKDELISRVYTTCSGNRELAERIRPFSNLLRQDAWEEPIIYKSGSFMVTLGADRRETGTHYTPKSLTESIVATTLELAVYIGPAEGKPKEEWTLKSSAAILELKICDPAMGSGAFLVQTCRYLGEKLVDAWKHEEDNGKAITVDGVAHSVPLALDTLGAAEPLSKATDDRLVIARRLVAERCLYGVDINPLAVELAKLSIWLVTLAKGRPFGFLDHNLRSGDSLLGIHKLEQLSRLSTFLFGQNIQGAIDDAIKIRKELRSVNILDIQDVERMAELDTQAREKLESVELIADAMTGVTLKNCSSENALESALSMLSTFAEYFLNGSTDAGKQIKRYATSNLSIDLPAGKPARKPFHWALEFPEVFANGGFDGIVGNPPFMGGQKISGNLGTIYLEYLKYAYAPAGAIDMVGFFFRRDFDLLKTIGAFGNLATNTIAQGDTREGSLEIIEKQNGALIMAIKSMPWPGKAAVSVSIAVIYKGEWKGTYRLDGKKVSYISSFFDDQNSIGNPYPLLQNADKSFQGSIVLGKGFVLTPEEAQNLITRTPKNADVVLPYLNGEALNTQSDQKAVRWIINFKDWPLDRKSAEPDYDGPVAADYPDCIEIVEQLVKPERTRLDQDGNFVLRKPLPQRWWHYAEKRPALYNVIALLERILVIARVSNSVSFSFVSPKQVFDDKLMIFATDKAYHYSILQSTIHFFWAWKYCTTLGEGFTYTPNTIFLPFPFPAGLEPNKVATSSSSKQLDELGEKLETARREIMLRFNIGLTDLYNLYHTQELSANIIAGKSKCSSEDAVWGMERITSLRTLQQQIDEAVRDAYGWNDLALDHGFYELEFLPENDRVRFTVSNEARREILKRLLELNHKRHQEEVDAGLVDEKGKPLKKKAKKGKPMDGKELWEGQNL
ncbi:Eco57I restriction-modification methylase domain-containing protein [Breznakiellaceae bacterium SP9]